MIVVLTLIGFILRLLTVRTQGTYWFDEHFSVHFAAMPLAPMLHFLLRDVHPTFYYLVLHFWIALFGDSETVTRLLSAVIGALCIPAVARLASRVFGRRTAVFAALFTAVSPILLFHSAEARMYPLLILLTALATTEFLDLMRRARTGEPLRFWRWGLLAGAMLDTHFTALTPFAIMVAAGWSIFRADRKARRRFLLAAALAAVPFCIWLAVTVSARHAFLGNEWQLNPGGTAPTLASRFMDFFAYGSASWIRSLLFIGAAAALLAALFSWKRLEKTAWRVELEKRPDVWMLGALAAGPFLAFLSVYTGATKYFFTAFPAAVTLVAAGVVALLYGSEGRMRLDLKFDVAALLLCAIVADPVAQLTTQRRFQFDKVASFIEQREQSGDLIYLSWFTYDLSMSRYYHGRLPIAASDPYPGLPPDDLLVLHSGQGMSPDQVKGVIANLEARVASARRVFLITGAFQFAGAPADSWFIEHGWKVQEKLTPNSFTPTVYLLTRP